MMGVFTLATCSPSLFLRSSRHGQLQQSLPHSLSTSSFMMQPLLNAHQDNRQLKTDLVPLPNTHCYLDDVNGENGAVRKLRGRKQVSVPLEVFTSGTLYPPIGSHIKGQLRVSSLHKIYYEIFGNPNGMPVVFLHGGPGAGCTDRHARFFDPQHYRIVLFDQRGCGKSKPRGCLEENTTGDLVADLEKLRVHLGETSWIVMGGSWGVTLALAYAQSHPQSVAGLILRGVCLLRPQEIDWFYKKGANILHPFSWEKLLRELDPSEREDVLSAYYKRLTSSDTTTQQRAAQAWLKWEYNLSFFNTSPDLVEWNGETYNVILVPDEKTQGANEIRPTGSLPTLKPPPPPPPTGTATATATPMPTQDLSSSSSRAEPDLGDPQMSPQVVQARLESHYFVHGGFLEDNELIEGVSKIRHIPAIIVQGRYDFVCPLSNAFDLHRAWPEAHLRIVPNAGHSMYEPGILYELVRATDTFKKLKY